MKEPAQESEHQILMQELDEGEGRRRSQGFLLEKGGITPRGKFTREMLI